MTVEKDPKQNQRQALFVAIDNEVEKWAEEFGIEVKDDETLAQLVEALLIYAVTKTARVGKSDFVVEGQVYGGSSDVAETYAFEFLTKCIKSEKTN